MSSAGRSYSLRATADDYALPHTRSAPADVVAITIPGRLVILVMICVGVVLIPAQAAQLYNEVVSRRVIRGALGHKELPSCWLSLV